MKQTLIKCRELIDSAMYDDKIDMDQPEMAKLKFDLDALIAGMKAKEEPTIYNRLKAVGEELYSIVNDKDFDGNYHDLEAAYCAITLAVDAQYKYDTAESDPDTDRAEWERDQGE